VTVRVLLCDPQPVTRTGLRTILGACPGIDLVGEADTCDKAVRATAAARPDVVLVDVALLGFDPVGAVRRIAGAAPHRGPGGPGGAPAVVLLVPAVDERSVQALRAGALGALPKACEVDELVRAIDVARRGDRFIAPQIAGEVLDLTFDHPVTTRGSIALRTLTGREIEVLGLLAQGLSNLEIADYLMIGEPTVKYHVSQMLRKLQLRDRLQAVAFAYRNGMISAGGSADPEFAASPGHLTRGPVPAR
jgi:DNA-binding NarL/FixJ family response regulator